MTKGAGAVADQTALELGATVALLTQQLGFEQPGRPGRYARALATGGDPIECRVETWYQHGEATVQIDTYRGRERTATRRYRGAEPLSWTRREVTSVLAPLNGGR